MNKKFDFSNLQNIPDDLAKIMTLVENKQAEFVCRQFTLDKNTIYTIDVKLPRFKEDELYNNPEIHLLIPRGLCFIFVNQMFAHAIYGHPKFGNFGDYINSTTELKLTTYRYFRRKENGECVHWSAFQYDSIVYEVIGSKNVHLVVRASHFEEDIKQFTDLRYSFATKMGNAINNSVQNNISKILTYFLATGTTFCAESCFIDSQHIVAYDKTKIFFFAVTKKREQQSDSFVVIHPRQIDTFFTELGLQPVAETIVCNTEDDIKNAEHYFESQKNSEGAVVYCTHDDQKVDYVYKHKNYDYIFMRALREQMRKMAPTSRILKRFAELHIVHPDLQQMTDQALKFNAYYRLLKSENFFEQWVTHFANFKLLTTDEQQSLLDKFNEIEKSVGTLNVIMFVGFPGSGKSFLARSLKELLQSSVKDGEKVVHLEQDMFFNKGKSASKEYDKAIQIAMNDPAVTYLLLSKSNHCTQVRNKTYEILSKCSKNVDRTYVVMSAGNMESTTNIERTSEICVDRIMNRGFAHTSLFGKTESEVRTLLQNIFFKQWEPLTENESVYQVIDIDIEDNKESVVASCVYQLQNFGMLTENLTPCLTSVFEKIKAEDELQSKTNIKNLKYGVGYDAIVFDGLIFKNKILENESIKHKIDQNLLVAKDEFHITLHYYGCVSEDKASPFTSGTEYKIHIVGYVVDSNALALVVELPDDVSEKPTTPHITFALGPNIKPVYSKTLIEKGAIEPLDIVVTGKTKRVMVTAK
jgi:adenylate kinase family enzyme